MAQFNQCILSPVSVCLSLLNLWIVLKSNRVINIAPSQFRISKLLLKPLLGTQTHTLPQKQLRDIHACTALQTHTECGGYRATLCLSRWYPCPPLFHPWRLTLSVGVFGFAPETQEGRWVLQMLWKASMGLNRLLSMPLCLFLADSSRLGESRAAEGWPGLSA